MKKIIKILCFILLLPSVSANAQDLKKAAKIISGVTSKIRSSDITGTWLYEGVDVKFESNKLLRKAGGAVAANKIENQLDGQLSALGFTPGMTAFTFNEDGTFENTTVEKTLKGTYSLDEDNGTITLKYMNMLPVKAKIYHSGNNMSFLYETGGLLSVASFATGVTGSGILNSVSSVLGSYDGMQTGMAFKRR